MANEGQIPALDAELSELYRAHADGLLRYAGALARTADEGRDAVQEAFLRYFAERRYGRTIEHPRAWLYQVLRNYLLTALAVAQRETSAEGIEQVPSAADDPERMVERRQRGDAILDHLTPREIDCLRLRTEGYSYEEIAGQLNVRSGTVGAILTKTHRKLRWPPGKNGKIGLGTAAAICAMFLETLTESS
jgi:RNA polymerase sigma-70 factor, ECF subfamily